MNTEFITDALVTEIEREGKLLGEQEPSSDSKYSFYRVYEHAHLLYALAYQADYNGKSFIHGYQIDESKVGEYI